jgi:cytochrome c oxidase subunit II
MQKWIMFVLFIAASVLGLYLLTFGLPDKPKDESAGLPEGVTLMKVEATNWEFDQQEYHVKKGDKVLIRLQEKSGFHGFKVDALDIDLSKDKPEQQVEFTEAGTFQIYCSIPCGEGHQEMKATLIVE